VNTPSPVGARPSVGLGLKRVAFYLRPTVTAILRPTALRRVAQDTHARDVGPGGTDCFLW